MRTSRNPMAGKANRTVVVQPVIEEIKAEEVLIENKVVEIAQPIVTKDINKKRRKEF